MAAITPAAIPNTNNLVSDVLAGARDMRGGAGSRSGAAVKP
jgi:hypothetical protein